MARVPLLDETAGAEVAAVIAKIRGGRGGRLLNLYRALLNSPGLASAWFDFNNAARFQTGVSDRLRELVIMRVAALTGCDYVWNVHESQYAAPAGVTPQEVKALRRGRKGSVFGPRDRALLAYVDAVTRDVRVPATVFGGMRKHYRDRETVEITVLIAAYNMHTRLLKALDIRPEES